MYYGELEKILYEINSAFASNTDEANSAQNLNIIGEIKEKLAAKYPDVYEEWEWNNFDINYLFLFQDEYVSYECTLLHISARCSLENVVNTLLENNADVDVKDGDGKIPLYCAAEHGHVEVVKALLKSSSNANATDKSGTTSLHSAALFGYVDVINALLDGGAEVDIVDQSGKTPLYWAALCGHENIVDALLTRGANINIVDCDGKTLLHCAAENNDMDVTGILLARGISVNITDGEHGGTPLHWAAGNGNIEIINILLALENIDINARDKYGNIPLHLAASYDHAEVVKALLAAGADINITDRGHGGTPLHCAAGNGHTDIVKILLAGGIDVNAVDKYGDTALHRAAERGNAEVVKALLAADAEVNPIGSYGTPLHYAVMCGCTDVILILLVASADVSLKNSENRDPIGLIEGCVRQFLKDAVNELYRMKNQTIGSTDISFYTFLKADKINLASYAHDDKLYEKLKEGRYKKAYPKYASMLEDQYKIVERKYLERKALEPLGCFGTFDENRQVKKTWEVLNEHVCELIMTYLTDTDLENVMNSREEKKASFLGRLSKWLG